MKKVLVLCSAAVVALALMAASSIDPVSEGVDVGEIAPDFNLMNVDGEMISLSDYKAEEGHEAVKGFIITFTCNTCPYAIMYEDRLIKLHNKMAPVGWPVVAIQPNDPSVKPGDSIDKMKERATEKGFPFVYLMDEGQKVYPKFGAERTPHVFLLDTDRKVHYIGAIDDSARDPKSVTRNYVEDAISAIEKGNTPDPVSTKAIGCSIKTKK